MDVTAVTALLDAGLKTEEGATLGAVRSMADAVDHAKADNRPLLANVPQMLHMFCDATLRHLLSEATFCSWECMGVDAHM